MSHSYVSCWEKVKRSNEQIADLNREIDAFLDEPPYGASRVIYDIDSERFQELSKLHHGREIPLRFSVLVGEIVHNLRSALDHLAFQLVKAAGNRPTRKTAFPLFTKDPTGDKKATTSYDSSVEGMSLRAKALINRLQPYQPSRESTEGDPLAILSRLSNRDKHRELNIVGTVSTGHSSLLIFHDIPNDDADGSSPTMVSDIAVDVGGKLTTDISLDEADVHGPLVDTMTRLSDETRQVIAIFAKLFPDT